MEKRWWHDPIVWLMSISMLMIAGLCVFWLLNTYDSKREALQKETDFVFSSAIRSLEDSLIHSNFYDNLLIDSSSRHHLRGWKGHRHQVVDTPVVAIVGTANPESLPHRFRRRDIRKMRERHLKDHDRFFVGSLSLHLRLMGSDSLTTILADSTSDQAAIALLDGRLSAAFAAQSYPFSSELVSYGEGETLELTFATKPYHDLLSRTNYVMAFGDVKGHLIRQMAYEIAFSLLLIGLTLLAFVFTYRSLRRQRRLALLRNDLISNITHELKTPIATVGVALEALSNFDAAADPAKSAEYLEISRNELDRLALLVDKVLKTSVQEGKEMQMTFEPVDLKELVEGILRSMQLQFGKMAAQVNFTCQDPSVAVRGDRVHLTSVIYNLLDNALKYGGAKPTIDIGLSSAEDTQRLVIADHGIGIAAEYQPQIFDKFFRVPNANVHNAKGYGLGLSYVAQVIDEHQGSIDVQSRPGHGTTFTIALPKPPVA